MKKTALLPGKPPCRKAALARGTPLRKRGARGRAREAFLAEQKLRVIERDGPGCRRCATLRGTIDQHHLKSRGRGGSDELDNLLLLCRRCHDGVTFQTVPDWREWIVETKPAPAEPATVQG